MIAPALLLITDPAIDVVAVVSAALRAADARVVVMLRDKRASASELAGLARALRGPCHDVGARLVVNDRADVARAVGADGVHLPEAGLSVLDARAVLGPGALVGCSRHDREGVARAAHDGADYATLGPVGEVPGKGPPLGLAGFDVRGVPLPVLALGGVLADDVGALLARGAAGIAVSRSVMHAVDPAAAVRRLLDAIGAAPLSSRGA